jgi:hypothetical protein
MTAEAAERFTWGLVEMDRETGKYRRANSDPDHETAIINEAKLRDWLKAGAYASSPWSRSLSARLFGALCDLGMKPVRWIRRLVVRHFRHEHPHLSRKRNGDGMSSDALAGIPIHLC